MHLRVTSFQPSTLENLGERLRREAPSRRTASAFGTGGAKDFRLSGVGVFWASGVSTMLAGTLHFGDCAQTRILSLSGTRL